MKAICEGLSLCERVIEDKQTGLLTLVGWLERFQAVALPGVHHGFAFATRFCLADGGWPE